MKMKKYLLGMVMPVLFFATCHASAQEAFPNRPLKIVVPFTAGGIVDTIARIMGERLSAKTGQPVIVENKAGAGGVIGTDAVAKAPADGYTLLAVSPGHTVARSVMKGVAWDPVRDFRAIYGYGVSGNVFVVHPGSPIQTMADLVAAARKSTEPIQYASGGIGTSNHLSAELLSQRAGIKLAQIAYKGQPEALNDVLAGRVSLMPLTVTVAAPHIRAGKLRALAVTSARRSPLLPEVPTVAEAANLPGFEVNTWFGLVVPAKTPDAVAHKLSAYLADIVAQPEVQAKFLGLGMEVAPKPPGEFDAFIAADTAKWDRVMKQAGITPQ